MRQLERPIMMCPICARIEAWNTSRLATEKWDRHIRKCKREQEEMLDPTDV